MNTSELAILWPSAQNEHGGRMLWYGSWLVARDGGEGEGFYSGRGGERQRYAVPAGAIGLRIRRWPNEGFDAEYVDLLDLDGVGELAPETLDFDQPQPFSRLELEQP